VAAPLLRTSIGDFSLHEYQLKVGARSWSFLHTGAILTHAQEHAYLACDRDRLPYGVMLWPASIALAHDVVARTPALRGKRVLELGAGTGMPGVARRRGAADRLERSRAPRLYSEQPAQRRDQQ
jgi:predicted nicotinamide N-methyase